jgi:hypothetical protein
LVGREGYNEAVADTVIAQNEIENSLSDQEIQSFGLDPDQIDDLADSISDMADESEDLADSLMYDADAAREVAKEIARYDKALGSIADNYDDWIDIMENGTIQD